MNLLNSQKSSCVKSPLKLIFLSVFCIQGLFWAAFFLYKQIIYWRVESGHYVIEAILQTGSEKEVLSTSYLAELMHLSVDMKSNLIQFDTKSAENRLRESPVIQEVKVKKIFPETVYVDYVVREPVCTLYDYENVAMDREGYLFPLHPFFSPKKLPEVYLGLLPFGIEKDDFGRVGGRWNCPLRSQEAVLALEVLQKLAESEFKNLFHVLRIDTSNAYSELCGQRQLILILEDVVHQEKDKKMMTYIFPRILRLSTDHYEKDLQQYIQLRSYLIDKAIASLNESVGHSIRAPATIIDLRLPQLAFVKGTKCF